RGDAERLEADLQGLAERGHAADQRGAQHAVAPHPRDERLRDDLDLAERRLVRLELAAAGDLLRRGLANGDGPRRDAAHHHALEHRLAADGRVAPGLLRLPLAHSPTVSAET